MNYGGGTLEQAERSLKHLKPLIKQRAAPCC
jgi:hypothetical protein